MVDLRYLSQYFEIKQILYSGADGTMIKAQLTALTPGKISKDKLGLEIRIKDRKEELVNEVKRIGYLNDRQIPLEVRVGDHLVVYISNPTA